MASLKIEIPWEKFKGKVQEIFKILKKCLILNCLRFLITCRSIQLYFRCRPYLYLSLQQKSCWPQFFTHDFNCEKKPLSFDFFIHFCSCMVFCAKLNDLLKYLIYDDKVVKATLLFDKWSLIIHWQKYETQYLSNFSN